ncbi:similar to Saccharomyces cerevisiae YGR177C ATF2 Alcohol acetyltransferase, may play a role in steroid detoxification [Maudiozyma barnettii]|uniref:Similar to Saccharomyces cerevisiae YGR177C ATF2 Alcohol acetyltransferase, may play a role in steroid detoxification n=1 Tax=Maudiozyma barnettii TaxID=61262 RepID=A0A8H2ZIC4_9SACH|nr:alcohol O-acetyltransferase [Kazachstania barnettii]CAB4255758.1 similar to Saccharomyces cerevisiae YGR177C ATF2 Alcohol acetyltransferase, may play a role in steroid detoxification [Kazachstania barnettii]CAD1784319.1 similar to Saccharomyces cerevisiae YGR177C ATF2 Alcohol acetyltransferase, may play a role in steroid detoxification [Kazachstania barnettii]
MSETQPLLNETDTKVLRGHKRHLGHLENYFALLQRQELYGNFSISCKLNHGITYADLVRGLRSVVLANPIMMHTMVSATKKGLSWDKLSKYYRSAEYLDKPWPEHDYMEVVDHLSLKDVVLNEQTDTYGDLLLQLQEQFQSDNGVITENLSNILSRIRIPVYQRNQPNWRILCLNSNYMDNNDDSFDTLVFISNHCCADAMTGINLFQDIVSAINKNGTVKEEDSVQSSLEIWNYERDYSECGKLPIPITDRVNYVPSILGFIWLIISTIVNGIFNYKSICEKTERIEESKPQLCYQTFVRFTPDEIIKIKKQINKEKCTMTALMQTALCITLKEHGIFNNCRRHEITFDITVPNNTRKALPESLAQEQYKYGANVGGLHYSYLISSFQDSQFWSLARYYNGVFKTGDYLSGLGSLMLSFVTQNKNMDAMIADEYLNKKRGGIILSNVGVINTSTGSEDNSSTLQIEDMLFMQNLGVLNFSYSVNIVTTTLGGMNLCMSAVEGAVASQEEFTAFGNELRAKIMDKCD